MFERFAAFLRLELAPSPARWRATARVVIACAIATTLESVGQRPEGSWLIITILIVSQPDAGASIAKALERAWRHRYCPMAFSQYRDRQSDWHPLPGLPVARKTGNLLREHLAPSLENSRARPRTCDASLIGFADCSAFYSRSWGTVSLTNDIRVQILPGARQSKRSGELCL